MNHAILKLSAKQAYVLVKHNIFGNVKNQRNEWKVEVTGEDETWYDTNKFFIEEGMTKIGDTFLNGKITKILSFEDYSKKYPEVTPRFDEVNEETEHGGFIRTVSADRMKTTSHDNWSVEKVMYAVNPLKFTMTKLMQSDIA